MKKIIIRFLVDEGINAASGVLRKISEDPVGFFTPYHERVTCFAFFGQSGDWRISKGAASERIVRRVESVCQEFGVADGWVAYKEDEGKRWVDCSDSFPPAAKQRLRNEILGV